MTPRCAAADPPIALGAHARAIAVMSMRHGRVLASDTFARFAPVDVVDGPG